MRAYAGVCGRMRAYAGVCGRMLTYADVCGSASCIASGVRGGARERCLDCGGGGVYVCVFVCCLCACAM
jgi:hypothetical protein